MLQVFYITISTPAFMVQELLYVLSPFESAPLGRKLLHLVIKVHGQLGAALFIQPNLDGCTVGWNILPRMVLLICFMGSELYKIRTSHAPGDVNTCAVRAK
jgi:hypothetical protein